MTLIQAIVLGIIQGLGEFLPISSSGHLIVVPWLVGWGEHSLAFDVALHAGTLAAVVAAFYRDWWKMGTGFGRGLLRGAPLSEPEGRLLVILAVATIPGAVLGKLFEARAETVFRNPLLVACAMAVMGLILWVADRRARTGEKSVLTISWLDALLIGCAQAIALVPGVSRSGATITMALFLGFRRDQAARFSFLLATPIIAGATILKVPHVLHSGAASTVLWGMVFAAVFGFLSIRVLLRYVRDRTYLPFVYYRLAFAALVVVMVATGTRAL